MDNLVHITQYVRLGIILAACQPATVCEVLQYDEKKILQLVWSFANPPLDLVIFLRKKNPNFFLETEPLVHPCANLVIHLTSGADGG